MLLDPRMSTEFRYAEAYYQTLYEPGFGAVTYASEVTTSPDGRFAAFTGSIIERLDGNVRHVICVVELASGVMRQINHGNGSASSAHWSQCGTRLAFLTDKLEPGVFQPCIVDTATFSHFDQPVEVSGSVEYLAWSPDGRRILLGVAGAGAELSGMQGATTTPMRATDLPAWVPTVYAGPDANEWRCIWVHDLGSGHTSRLSADGTNPWEACWAGPEHVLAVVSDRPDEAAWYIATLRLIRVSDGCERVIHAPVDQLGNPAASPDGRHLAVIEAVCSDRSVVAGDLLVGTADRGLQRVPSLDVDVTHFAWRDNRRVVAIGVRGFDTVVIEYDVEASTTRELWLSADIHCGFWYPALAVLGEDSCIFVAEAYLHPPEIVIVRDGALRRVLSCAHADTSRQLAAGLYGDRTELVTWQAPDGLEVQGTLLLPSGSGPFPTIMEVHGGPIWAQRSRWMAGIRAEPQAFVHRGYAVFRPNPRGSGGRGQSYARKVVGDMGGLDTHDLLSGIDELVRRGYANPDQLAVTGVSYGGFMSSWIVTQDARFKASIPISPVTNWVSMQWTTNVPHFVRQFLDNDPMNANGLYHRRSPVNFADRVTTPTLVVAGELDRISPPGQAIEYYRALRQQGVDTELVLYPLEGHNVRNMPATIDASARYIHWLDRHVLGRSSAPASWPNIAAKSN